jgi:hypothetical protein
VISEPGYCAFFYPNANWKNEGPGNPYTDGGYYRNSNWQNGNASIGHRQLRHRMHSTWTKVDLKKGGLLMKANQRHVFSRHDGAHYDAAAMANGQTSEFLKQQLLWPAVAPGSKADSKRTAAAGANGRFASEPEAVAPDCALGFGSPHNSRRCAYVAPRVSVDCNRPIAAAGRRAGS